MRAQIARVIAGKNGTLLIPKKPARSSWGEPLVNIADTRNVEAKLRKTLKYKYFVFPIFMFNSNVARNGSKDALVILRPKSGHSGDELFIFIWCSVVE